MKSTNYAAAVLMLAAAALSFVGANGIAVGLIAVTAALVVLTGTFAAGKK